MTTNKEKALQRLTQIENEAKELRAIIEAPDTSNYEQAKKWLLDYMSKPFEVKLTKGCITYYRDGRWVINQNLKNKKLLVYYHELWEVFEKNFSLEYEQIKALHKEVVGEALNCKECTPDCWLKMEVAMVGEALNCD